MAKKNEGAPGIDGVTFATIEAGGGESFLQQIGDERVTNTYQPMRVRKKEIPQEGGTKVRILSIPSIRDRVVQLSSASGLAREGGGQAITGRVGETPGGDKRREESNRGSEEGRKLRLSGLRVSPRAEFAGRGATAVYAQAEEADGVAGEAAGPVAKVCEPAGGEGDRADQPDPARRGELLCRRTLESVLCVYPRLGGKEDPAPPDACPETSGLRLEAME